MKSVSLVCACAATMLAASGSALAGPQGSQWQAAPTLERAQPLRVAKFTKVNGKIVITTPWYERNGQPVADTTVEPAFDCFEGNPLSLPPLNVPQGFLTCGANAANFPGAQDGSRWYGGATWLQPRSFNDMTVGQGFNGTDAVRLSWAWFQPVTVGSFFIAVSTYEDFGSTCVFPVDPGFIDGIIFEFGAQAVAQGWYGDEDLTIPTPLPLGLPADGSGAYEIEFFSDAAATTLETTPGTQPFYWGTGEDEPTPDGRTGTQDINGWDDDTAPFGAPYAASECYNHTSGTAPQQCPLVLGVMMEFWAKGTACYADCNETGTLTVADFICFQTRFVAQDPYADCNGTGTFTVADFICFQNAFVGGCP